MRVLDDDLGMRVLDDDLGMRVLDDDLGMRVLGDDVGRGWGRQKIREVRFRDLRIEPPSPAQHSNYGQLQERSRTSPHASTICFIYLYFCVLFAGICPQDCCCVFSPPAAVPRIRGTREMGNFPIRWGKSPSQKHHRGNIHGNCINSAVRAAEFLQCPWLLPR